MSKGLKRAQKASRQISEEREFQAEGTAGARVGSGLKVGEVVSNGGNKQTSMEHKLMSPPDVTLGHHKIKHTR